jgi:hypothetical protein
MIGLRHHLPDILHRRASGQTYREIGDAYGYTHQRVQQLVVTENPAERGRTWCRHDPSLIREARNLWNSGLTTREIAAALSTEERPLTRYAIIGISHRNGFPYRNPPK